MWHTYYPKPSQPGMPRPKPQSNQGFRSAMPHSHSSKAALSSPGHSWGHLPPGCSGPPRQSITQSSSGPLPNRSSIARGNTHRGVATNHGKGKTPATKKSKNVASLGTDTIAMDRKEVEKPIGSDTLVRDTPLLDVCQSLAMPLKSLFTPLSWLPVHAQGFSGAMDPNRMVTMTYTNNTYQVERWVKEKVVDMQLETLAIHVFGTGQNSQTPAVLVLSVPLLPEQEMASRPANVEGSEGMWLQSQVLVFHLLHAVSPEPIDVLEQALPTLSAVLRSPTIWKFGVRPNSYAKTLLECTGFQLQTCGSVADLAQHVWPSHMAGRDLTTVRGLVGILGLGIQDGVLRSYTAEQCSSMWAFPLRMGKLLSCMLYGVVIAQAWQWEYQIMGASDYQQYIKEAKILSDKYMHELLTSVDTYQACRYRRLTAAQQHHMFPFLDNGGKQIIKVQTMHASELVSHQQTLSSTPKTIGDPGNSKVLSLSPVANQEISIQGPPVSDSVQIGMPSSSKGELVHQVSSSIDLGTNQSESVRDNDNVSLENIKPSEHEKESIETNGFIPITENTSPKRTCGDSSEPCTPNKKRDTKNNKSDKRVIDGVIDTQSKETVQIILAQTVSVQPAENTIVPTVPLEREQATIGTSTDPVTSPSSVIRAHIIPTSNSKILQDSCSVLPDVLDAKPHQNTPSLTMDRAPASLVANINEIVVDMEDNKFTDQPSLATSEQPDSSPIEEHHEAVQNDSQQLILSDRNQLPESSNRSSQLEHASPVPSTVNQELNPLDTDTSMIIADQSTLEARKMAQPQSLAKRLRSATRNRRRKKVPVTATVARVLRRRSRQGLAETNVPPAIPAPVQNNPAPNVPGKRKRRGKRSAK